MLELTGPLQGSKSTVKTRSRRIVTGYVYLMRYGAHGKDFKIGHSDNVQRRLSQIDMVSPSDVRVVHSIETDDLRVSRNTGTNGSLRGVSRQRKYFV